MLNVGKILSDLYERLVHSNIIYNLLGSPDRFALPGNSDPKNFQALRMVKKVHLLRQL